MIRFGSWAVLVICVPLTSYLLLPSNMVKYEAEVVGGAVVVVLELKDFGEDCTVSDDNVVVVDDALFRNKRFVLNLML